MKDRLTEEKISALIDKMTLREKIGQLNMIPSPSAADEDIFEMLRRGESGSFIMSSTAHAYSEDSVSADEALINEMHRIAVEESRLGIPVMFGRDVIHGHYTVLPVPLALAQCAQKRTANIALTALSALAALGYLAAFALRWQVW